VFLETYLKRFLEPRSSFFSSSFSVTFWMAVICHERRHLWLHLIFGFPPPLTPVMAHLVETIGIRGSDSLSNHEGGEMV